MSAARRLGALLFSLGLVLPGGVFAAADIIALTGTGEMSPYPEAAWSPARQGQTLVGGSRVRTGTLSRMALLFDDGTQLRLNQKSLLEIKPTEQSQGSTALLQRLGRIWARSKTVPEQIRVETPAATASIRGTEWELEVGDDGRATLTVLQGTVDFFNDQGRVEVNASEQAVAEVGRAPSKRLLLNPRERVQWVSTYPLQPLRHIDFAATAAGTGTYRERAAAAETLLRRPAATPAGADSERLALARAAQHVHAERFAAALTELQTLTRRPLKQPAAWLILADLMLFQGLPQRAVDYARQATRQFPDDPRGHAQLAKAYLYAERLDAGRQAARQALSLTPPSWSETAAWLIDGELALFDGDAAAARRAFAAAAERNPDDDRAWFGLGRIASEREDVRLGRVRLGQALALYPDGPGYQGELGTLLTLGNDFTAAERAFDLALEQQPGDYVALTGAGLLALKRGRPAAALEKFLAATTLQPRYARAHLYAGVAYYQQGKIDQALDELAAATQADPNDPLPHFMASAVHTDLFHAGAAIRSAGEALRLMPKLKSLNQLFNDQRGSANLGSGLAFFGLEDWALNYAQRSYYPYWAGSHLFLADRYTEPFLKNAELYQGFLAEPTVFGSSNRFQTLLAAPGHYGELGLFADRDDAFQTVAPRLVVNGYAQLGGALPAAYFLNLEHENFSPRGLDFDGQLNSATAALGANPSFALGLFAFGNVSNIDEGERFVSRTIEDDEEFLEISDEFFSFDSHRLDVGVHYKFAPRSQLWFKVGSGKEALEYDEEVTDESGEELLQLTDYTEDNEFLDLALRHTVDLGRLELTWGLEYGSQDKLERFLFADEEEDFSGVDTADDRSFDLYASLRYRVNDRLLLEGGLFWQRYRKTLQTEQLDDLFDCLDGTSDCQLFLDGRRLEAAEANPRLGLEFELAPGQLLRLVYQDWRRPTAVSTLGPVATAGIPLDTRLANNGGKTRRARIQLDSEWGTRLYSSLFVEHTRVRNLPLLDGFVAAPSRVDDLERLRNRRQGNLANENTLEDTPSFERGELTGFGLALNAIIGERWSGYTNYRYNNAENTADDAAQRGRPLPYLPRHTGVIGATYIGPQRITVNGQAVYRSARHVDALGEDGRLDAGWSGSLRAYWETRDKRFSVEGRVDELFAADSDTLYSGNLSYRF